VRNPDAYPNSVGCLTPRHACENFRDSAIRGGTLITTPVHSICARRGVVLHDFSVASCVSRARHLHFRHLRMAYRSDDSETSNGCGRAGNHSFSRFRQRAIRGASCPLIEVLQTRRRCGLMVSACAGFSDAGNERFSARSGDGVREAPRHEIAVYGARMTRPGLWGFGRRIGVGVFEQSDRIDLF
jgi:hypothetical protein